MVLGQLASYLENILLTHISKCLNVVTNLSVKNTVVPGLVCGLHGHRYQTAIISFMSKPFLLRNTWVTFWFMINTFRGSREDPTPPPNISGARKQTAEVPTELMA